MEPVDPEGGVLMEEPPRQQEGEEARTGCVDEQALCGGLGFRPVGSLCRRCGTTPRLFFPRDGAPECCCTVSLPPVAGGGPIQGALPPQPVESALSTGSVPLPAEAGITAVCRKKPVVHTEMVIVRG